MRLAVAKHVGEDVEPSEANRGARADIAASFQRVAVLHLEQRTRRAIEWTRAAYPGLSALVVAGGVASNLVVRAWVRVRVFAWVRVRVLAWVEAWVRSKAFQVWSLRHRRDNVPSAWEISCLRGTQDSALAGA